MAEPDLSLAEHVCLVLVDQGVEHGWAIGNALEADGELGRVWSLSRPLVYRAVEQLVEKDLVRRTGRATGRAAARTLLAATPAGHRRARVWLDRPATHLRDVRTEVLLKLLLRERHGLPAEPYLAAQEAAFAPILDALTRSRPRDLVGAWRAEQARAVQRFLRRAATNASARAAP